MIKKIIFACMLSLLGVTLMACGGKTVLAPSITNGDSIYLSPLVINKYYHHW